MPGQGKSRAFLRYAASTVLALALTLGIYCVGTAGGDVLLKMQKEYRIELFNRALEEQNAIAKILTDRQAQSVAAQYAAALADAVVKFEFFPRTDDAKLFLDILTIVPDEITVEKFEFIGRNITLYCSASSEEALQELSEELGELDSIQDTSLESYQKTDGTYMGAILCMIE